MPMETFDHGILSGIDHPLLGFDHLFFVLAVGIAALYTGKPKLAAGAYIVGLFAPVRELAKHRLHSRGRLS